MQYYVEVHIALSMNLNECTSLVAETHVQVHTPLDSEVPTAGDLALPASQLRGAKPLHMLPHAVAYAQAHNHRIMIFTIQSSVQFVDDDEDLAVCAYESTGQSAYEEPFHSVLVQSSV